MSVMKTKQCTHYQSSARVARETRARAMLGVAAATEAGLYPTGRQRSLLQGFMMQTWSEKVATPPGAEHTAFTNGFRK